MDEASDSFLYTLPGTISPDRADKVLARQFDDLSRSQIQKSLDAGLISRGEQVLKRREKLQPGDELVIEWLPEPSSDIRPVNIPLEVLFEDEAVVVVNKAPGMVTHPGSGTGEDTLVHALLYHTEGHLSPVGAPDRPGIVHRLDKETSGVIVVAKTEGAHHALVRQFSQRTTRKEYLAWVNGEPKEASGSIQAPIDRHPVVRTRMQVCKEGEGRFAHTDWKIIWKQAGAALVRCRIHTGRTHQIRVHMQHIGHPLLGDRVYGYKSKGRAWEPILRVMLHAETLELTHPISGEPLLIQAPIPEDFRELESRLTHSAS